jgi:serine/threonine-protein kinase HipA
VTTYDDLLEVTRRLTRDERSVTEMFRRACFNVLAHNRDDHTKNFAFLMDERGNWRPSPAYDLTYADGPGGEQTLSVVGEARNPTSNHLLALASRVGLKHGSQIVDEVRSAVSMFTSYADQCGLPKARTKELARALSLTTATGKPRRPAAKPRKR